MMYLDNKLIVPEAKKANYITAAVESEKVSDAEIDQSQLIGLDYMTWLPFAAKTYNISPRIEDYILVTTPICPSMIPNRNGIGFPTAELATFGPPPQNRLAYKAWTGCPVHYDHKNEIHTDAYGVILDTKFVPIKGYGNGQLWKVMGLLAIDKIKNPEMAQRVLDNDINTYSMGAYVDYFTCSYCNEPMIKKNGFWQHCRHLNPATNIDWSSVTDEKGKHLIYRNAHVISPIECSLVESPAWTTALSDEVFTMDNVPTGLQVTGS